MNTSRRDGKTLIDRQRETGAYTEIHTDRERERERQREGQTIHEQPVPGHDPDTHNTE